MIDWITENPWWTFSIVVVGITTAENVAKHFSSRLHKAGDLNLELENLELKDEIRKMENRSNRLVMENLELIRRLEASEANENLNKFNAKQAKRHEEADRAFDKAEQAFRAQQEEMQRNRFNYDDLRRASEGMRNQQSWAHNDRAKEQAKSKAEIKKKYRANMRKYHPDVVRANGGSEVEIAAANAKVQEINSQYEKDKKRWKL